MNQKNAQAKDSFARRNRTFFVGLFIAIPLVVMPVLVLYTLLKTDMMQRWCQLSIVTDNSYGLAEGSQVSISGMQIGYVGNLSLNENKLISVHFKVKDQFRWLIRKDTRATIKQKNFVVGDWGIELDGGSKERPIVADGDTLASTSFTLEDKIDSITSVVGVAKRILEQVLDGKGTIGKLVMEDSVVTLLAQIERNANALSQGASTAIHQTSGLVTNLTGVSNDSRTVIDSLMTVLASVKTTLAGAQGILGDVKASSSDLPMMLGRVRNDVGDAEALMRSLRKNWLLRAATGPSPDPLIGKDP